MAELTAKTKIKKNKNYRMTAGDRIFDYVNIFLMCLLMIVTLYPFINTLAVSLNNPQDSIKGGIYLLPRVWTLENYNYVLGEASVLTATLVSIARTVVGTVVTVLCSAMVAYTISRDEFVLRKFVTLAFILTMYFSGGLIPEFLLMRDLHLIKTFWIYILPGMIGVFNLIIIRSFIYGLPDSILESARIDGAGEFRTFFSIVLPLCMPVLATVALFTAVFQWNAWFDVFLYNSSVEHLSTLQYELQKMLASSNATSGSINVDFSAGAANSSQVTPLSVRATMTIVASVPIIMVYPFVQKYFVKGMMVGGVKG